MDVSTLYKDLIKRVHPDINPGLPDATLRAQMVNVAKDNMSTLIRLAVSWGYMARPAGFFEDRTYGRPFTTNQTRPSIPVTFKSGTIVNIIYGEYSNKRAVIVEKTKKTNGHKYTLYIIGLYKFVTVTLTDTNSDKMFKKAARSTAVVNEARSMWKAHKENRFSRFNLTMNTVYNDLVGSVNFNGRVYHVNIKRTSEKMVYFTFINGVKEHRVSIEKVYWVAAR